MIWILQIQRLVREMKMNEKIIGRLLNMVYDTEKKTLRITIDIIDENFKEELLRNPELKEKIIFKGDDVMRVSILKNKI